MDEMRLTKIVKIVTSVATAFVFLMVAIIIAEYIKISSLNRKIEDVTNELNSLSSTESELNDNLEYHSTSVYIEDYARRELRMLDQGENYIIFE